MDSQGRHILFVNGQKWGAYLTKEAAEEVAARREAKGDTTSIELMVEGYKDQ